MLVVCGQHDPQYPPACSEELAAGIRHAALVSFERSGHFPFIEEPEAFWATVDAFLTAGGVDRAAGASAPAESP